MASNNIYLYIYINCFMRCYTSPKWHGNRGTEKETGTTINDDKIFICLNQEKGLMVTKQNERNNG